MLFPVCGIWRISSGKSGRTENSSEALFPAFLLAPLNVAAPVAQLIVADPVIIKAGQDIVHRCLGDVVQCLFCQERLMGGDDHVGHGNQAGQQFIVQDMSGTILEEDVCFFR